MNNKIALEVMRKAKEMDLPEDFRGGICLHISRAVYLAETLDGEAYEAAEEYLCSAIAAELSKINPCCLFYGHWLGLTLGYSPANSQIIAGRRLWVDQIITSLENDEPFPPPPIPPGAEA